jgi:hypothetical protein
MSEKKVYVAIDKEGNPIAVANNLVRLGRELDFHPKHFTRIKLPHKTHKGIMIYAMPLLTSKRINFTVKEEIVPEVLFNTNDLL